MTPKTIQASRWAKWRGLCLAGGVATLAAGSVTAQTAYYVSPTGSDAQPGTLAQPFKTLEKARDTVRTVNTSMTADITVYLRGGTYVLTNTVAFDQRDSGTNGYRVIYRAYPNELPELSGGQTVTNWQSVGGGLYKAQVGAVNFRQLYVNGKRAVRARYPNDGSYLNLIDWLPDSGQVTVPTGLVANWQNLSQVEFVVYRHWDQDNLRLASVTDNGSLGYLTFQSPESARSMVSLYPQKESGQAFYFENAYEFLDAPGEWYLQTASGELFYRPRPGEDLATATVIIPKVQTLLKVTGTLTNPVRDLHFIGLTYRYTTWLEPSTEGYVGLQSGITKRSVTAGYPTTAGHVPGAVHLENCTGVRIEGSYFELLGGSGLVLYRGVRHSVINGNRFRDIAGNGVMVDVPYNSTGPTNTLEVCSHNTIENNVITRVGRDYSGCVGVYGGFVHALITRHNTLYDLPYIGVQTGWGWTASPTVLSSNSISYNRLHHTMQRHDDGGAIYVMSHQPGSWIYGNYIHDMYAWGLAGGFPFAAVYLDNGTSNFTIQWNVFQRCGQNFYEQTSPPAAGSNTFGSNDTQDSAIIQGAGVATNFTYLIPAEPAPGLAAHWKFDETAGSAAWDWGGSEAVGTLFGGATWTTAGQTGGAVQLNGSTAWVDLPYTRINPLATNFTAAAWVKLTTGAGLSQGILAQRGYYGVTWLARDTASGKLISWLGGAQTTSSRTLTAGNWHHVAVSWNGSSLVLYVDGQRDTSATFSSLGPSISGFMLGRYKAPDANYGYWNGTIDEVRLYNKALSDAEIAALAGAGSGSTPLAWWKLDETSGSTLADATGNGFTGTVNGATPTTAGKINGAFMFDGNNNHLALPFVLNPAATAFTAAGWVWLSGIAGDYEAILAQTGTNGRPWLYRRNSDGKLCSYLGQAETASTTSLATGQWYHVALTVSGGTRKLYVNGVLENTATITVESETGSLLAGQFKLPNSSARNWNGKLDDLRLYNTALTASEITALAAATPTAPLAWWKLDETSGSTLADATGNGFTGTVNGATPTTAGKINGAFMFDGNNNHLALPFVLNPAATAFTAAGWVWLSGIAGDYEAILAQTGTNGRPWLYRRNSDGKLCSYLGQAETASTTSLATGQWYHVALTVSGGTRKLYVNGVLENTATITVESETGSLLAGQFKLPNSSARNWNGKLDDLRLYNTALTASEITALAAATPTAPLAWWKLDETSGSTLADATGNGFTGTVNGATPTTAGKINGAFMFDGNNNHLALPFVLNPAATAFTAAGWVWLSGIAGDYEAILAQTGTNGRPWLYRRNSDGKLCSYLGQAETASTTSLATGQWYHVALTVSGGTRKLYVNGVLENTATITVESETGSLLAGQFKLPNSSARNWNGKLDDLRLYNTALTASEITALAAP